MDRNLQISRLKSIDSQDFGWFKQNSYEPLAFRPLTVEELTIIADWAEEIYSTYPNGGLSGVEMMTMVAATIMSSGIKRVVQTGHYLGFSTLIIGMLLRSMGSAGKLYTVDISEDASAVTRSWVERAKLKDRICIEVADSSEPGLPIRAIDYLGDAPQLIYVDSSHQYLHTAAELALWYDALAPGGLIIMDDVSLLAATFDTTGLGGSHRAGLEFLALKRANGVLVNGTWTLGSGGLVYTDPCGFGLFQKSF